jgi:acetylornithine deacetylase
MGIVSLTQKLISYNTISHYSNLEVIDFIQHSMEKVDCNVERIEYTDKNGVAKANIIGQKGNVSNDPKKGIALMGHIDTVPAGGWDLDPFEGKVSENKLYGRGSCDMKGSVACMLEVISRYSANDLKSSLYLVVTADEEVGSTGAQIVTEKSEMFNNNFPRFGIIGEPTMLKVIRAHKGVIQFIVRSHGRFGHSSTGDGENANLKIIPFLNKMREIHNTLASDTQHFNHDFDPPFSDWNINISDGETAANVTPALSTCTITYRPMPGQNPQHWLKLAKQHADKYDLEMEILCWRNVCCCFTVTYVNVPV